ncbi:MAG: YigZ family protein [Ruminococcus sp.]|nr:YigZ family protein [Ruminococcus sp.]
MQSSYPTATYTEKRSKFIGCFAKVDTEEDCKAFLASVKKEYKGASHYVYAYILANNLIRYSDNGEPHGTGGGRLLGVLQHNNVVGGMLVVVRYFGGKKLGTGPLGRAYATAAQETYALVKDET